MHSRSFRIIACSALIAMLWGGAAAGDELVLDDRGRVVVEIDDEGRETHYAYHPNGQVSRIVYPDGRVEAFDASGDPVDPS